MPMSRLEEIRPTYHREEGPWKCLPDRTMLTTVKNFLEVHSFYEV